MNLRLSDIPAQPDCLQPQRACSTIAPGDILAFHPGQLGGHLAQSIA
jgi:hypothetical protein